MYVSNTFICGPFDGVHVTLGWAALLRGTVGPVARTFIKGFSSSFPQ